MKNRPAGPGVRLQKVLARAGIASRRAAEELIRSGRVRVDGRIASELGIRVDPRRARVEVDGKRIVAEPLVYLILHKPRGVVCTLSDPEGRPTVAELLREAGARVAPVGRLDFNTSGALLCTNDGEFANRLAHPSHHAPKEYLVKVGGVIDDAALDAFRRSITIDGRATRPAQVSLVRIEGDKSWLSVRLEEGRNRQVRRLAEEAGFVVMRLVRTAQAGVTVEGLRPGRFRPLGMDELVKLRDEYGVPRRIPKPSLEPVEDRRRVVPRDGRRGSQSEPRGDRREPRRAFQSESRRGGSQSEPRGDRREPRGGAQRESRGGFQRESRGGFQRESRGGFQRESRGGFQREPRGGFQRESRGGSQREPRGGFQRESRGGFQRESRGGFQRESRGGSQREPRGGFQREPRGGSQREPRGGSQREPRRDRRGPRR